VQILDAFLTSEVEEECYFPQIKTFFITHDYNPFDFMLE